MLFMDARRMLRMKSFNIGDKVIFNISYLESQIKEDGTFFTPELKRFYDLYKNNVLEIKNITPSSNAQDKKNYYVITYTGNNTWMECEEGFYLSELLPAKTDWDS